METGEAADGGLVRLPLELSCAYFDHLERLENTGTFRYNPRLDISVNDEQLLSENRVQLSYMLNVRKQASNNLMRHSEQNISTMLGAAMIETWDEGITAPGEDTEGEILFERYFKTCKPYDCTYYEEPLPILSNRLAFLLVSNI